jgi:hypothetical protein
MQFSGRLVCLSLIMDLATLVAAANILLLVGLIYIYGETFRKTRAAFSIGLLFFASFFLLQNAVAVYSYFRMSAFYAEGILPIVLIMNIAQLIGLLILFRTSA